MIVNEGKLELLRIQVPDLETLNVGLLGMDDPVTKDTRIVDLNEAAFSGYVRTPLGALDTVYLSNDHAVVAPLVMPEFLNNSGAPVTVYGWMLFNRADDEIVVAHNFGATVIPAGQVLSLSVRVSDTQE